MFLPKLEMVLNFLSQTKHSFLTEWETNDLHVHWQAGWCAYCLLNCLGKVIFPVALVILLIFASDCHGDTAWGHRQSIPDVGVCCDKVTFLSETLISSRDAESRTDHEVELIFSPIIYPLCAKLVNSSSFLEILMCVDLCCRIQDHGNSGLKSSHQKFEKSQEIRIHAWNSLKVWILINKFLPLKCFRKGRHVSFANYLMIWRKD